MLESTLHKITLAPDPMLESSVLDRGKANENNMENANEMESKDKIECDLKEKKNEETIDIKLEEKGTQDGIKSEEGKKASKPPSSYSGKGWLDILGNGELKMKIIHRGKCHTRPQHTDVCDIRLRGKLEDGRLVENHDLLRIHIGDHEVVQGLELALPLMNVGEKALVVVGPRFAYGTLGNPPDIPPNATIKYAVELVMAEILTPLENIPHDERMTMAISKRKRGNWWYSRQDATKAIQCYRKAVDLLDETIPYVTLRGDTIENTDDNIKIVVNEKMKVFNNLAAAQLMMEAYDSAMASIMEVLKHEPNNVKALYRKSKILSAKGYVSEAVAPLRQAFLLEPRNTAVLSELNKCLKLSLIEKRDEKNLYRKMLGQKLIDDKTPEQAPNVNRCNFHKFWRTAATATFMAVVAFAISYKLRNYPFI